MCVMYISATTSLVLSCACVRAMFEFGSKHQGTPYLFEVNHQLQMSLKATTRYSNEDIAWKRSLQIEPRES